MNREYCQLISRKEIITSITVMLNRKCRSLVYSVHVATEDAHRQVHNACMCMNVTEGYQDGSVVTAPTLLLYQE